MKAITYSQYGGAEVLQLTEVDDPKIGPDWVAIDVKATSVNPVDWKIASGGLDAMLPTYFPVVPGWDVAGVVTAVGPSVDDLAVGDEVYGYLRKDAVQDGTYAEKVGAPQRCVTRKPQRASFAEAAAIPLAGLTALQCLDLVGTTGEDTVLVHSAAGGVGMLAVQIARARGARVIGTASPDNHDFVRSLGAEPVAYGDGLVAAVRELAPDGVTAVLDTQGGDTLTQSVELLADGAAGRIASVADPSVAEHGGRYVFVRPDVADLTTLAGLVDAGEMRVEVAELFPLAETARAWERSMEGHVRGKLVITVP
ncbi:Narbonolide/10-deoxymethynolide synthase PikA2, modules 3 and 4 [Nocardioides aquaticus]|uniref:Narbonolide/10-deoxymethynolide synthase PikA2, modules 3 and 4 n=1 Tax=Nocardioides aquaticus TaxID=160826 RepID=A0ABX8ED32_9ACTN|nr:NADP-dependent oxidoreductase [Nocardioides aquaticus]QVT78373.1 Narbonolide/10-deoxymethynolide synthase PikA2, modules 3 and 4 [Nocardioides aquaticus]